MIQSAFTVTGFVPSTTPPDGPPSNVNLYQYSNLYFAVWWTNGDPDAHTEIAFVLDPTESVSPTPDDIIGIVNPGVAGFNSSEIFACTFYVRHKRGGQTTAWVKANKGSFSCSDKF